MNFQEKIIEEFVRDVCSVVPRSKSEVRRRLNDILLSALESQSSELKREIEKLKRECDQCDNKEKHDNEWNLALDEILKILK